MQSKRATQIGVMSFNTEYTMRVDHLARAVEERGFESLWLPEHTHIPAARSTPYPGGGPLPEEYVHMSDPFTSAAAAAAVTDRILIGTCISLINQHHPLALAKTVATVDRISEGRFILGVGAGWNVEEMNHHGIEYTQRWAQLEERIAAMRLLWTEETAEFHGDHVDFGPSWSYPKPWRKPHPPILYGAFDSKFGRRKVARDADGWIPIAFDIARSEKSLERLHEELLKAGRDPDQFEVSVFFLGDEKVPEETIQRAFATGVKRIIVRLPVADSDEVITELDRLAAFLP